MEDYLCDASKMEVAGGIRNPEHGTFIYVVVSYAGPATSELRKRGPVDPSRPLSPSLPPSLSLSIVTLALRNENS